LVTEGGSDGDVVARDGTDRCSELFAPGGRDDRGCEPAGVAGLILPGLFGRAEVLTALAAIGLALMMIGAAVATPGSASLATSRSTVRSSRAANGPSRHS
jgi:hypothetical protein